MKVAQKHRQEAFAAEIQLREERLAPFGASLTRRSSLILPQQKRAGA